MHIDFDPHKVDWGAFITFQTRNEVSDSDTNIIQDGYGRQYGSGSNFHYTAFSGTPYQRGSGIGSLFRSLMRYLIPLGKQAGAAIGRQGLDTGARVLTGVLDGKDLKETLVEESRTGLKNLLDKASSNIQKRNGQDGSGSFDFKRYKKSLGDNHGGLEKKNNYHYHQQSDISDNNGAATVGVFTQAPAKAINRQPRSVPGTSKLRSIIGPPLLPSPKSRKNKSTRKQTASAFDQTTFKRRRPIRIDSLGPY